MVTCIPYMYFANVWGGGARGEKIMSKISGYSWLIWPYWYKYLNECYSWLLLCRCVDNSGCPWWIPSSLCGLLIHECWWLPLSDVRWVPARGWDQQWGLCAQHGDMGELAYTYKINVRVLSLFKPLGALRWQVHLVLHCTDEVQYFNNWVKAAVFSYIFGTYFWSFLIILLYCIHLPQTFSAIQRKLALVKFLSGKNFHIQCILYTQ